MAELPALSWRPPHAKTRRSLCDFWREAHPSLFASPSLHNQTAGVLLPNAGHPEGTLSEDKSKPESGLWA
jgi:hypothetical protein